MKISDWLKSAGQQLHGANIQTARLDSLVLLGDITGKDRTHLLAHPELVITNEQVAVLQELLDRRAQHEPLAYIRGKAEFYGREFMVDKHVLQPRPESEAIIELLKSEPKVHNISTIIDVGTGSGALAITAALELPEAQVFGVDIDPECLKIARKNAQKYAVDIQFFTGDLLEPIFSHKFEASIAVLANLPYVPNQYEINQAATHEPKLALFGGVDGLDLYKTTFQQLHEHFNQPVTVLTESLPSQHHHLAGIARAQHYTQIAKSDFIQVFTNQ